MRLICRLLPGLVFVALPAASRADRMALQLPPVGYQDLGRKHGLWLSDHLELRLKLNDMMAFGGASTDLAPGLIASLRWTSSRKRVRLFTETSAIYQPIRSPAGNRTVFGVGLDAGLEAVLTGDCTFRLGAAFRHLRAADGGGFPEINGANGPANLNLFGGSAEIVSSF
jgi:hypothetical protein